MNTITTQCVDVCNKLLRGELAAIETYDQAIAKFDTSPHRADLDRMRRDHLENAGTLKDHLLSMQADPDTSSGVWGFFARTVEGTAGVFGESAALKALEEGEWHGIREYEEALTDPDVMDEIKIAIRNELLPRLVNHAAALNNIRERK